MGIISAIFGGDTPEEIVDEAKEQIRDIVETLDQDDDIDEWVEISNHFQIKKGSAHIRIEFVASEDFPPHVFFVSPIVRLPSNNLLAFYRRLLEINSESDGLFSIGVDGDVVEINLARAIEGLTECGMTNALTYVCEAADDLDDKLHEEFGAPFWEPPDDD